VIGKRLRPAFEQPLAHSRAMAACVVRRVCRSSGFAGAVAAFIEEWGIVCHLNAALPFPAGRRK